MAQLTVKQSAFIEQYLQNGFNATEAARNAGYKGNDATLAVVGYENLRKPKIRAVIDARLAEMRMTADEVIKQISDQAFADISDFIEINGGSYRLDLEKAQGLGKLHLVKSLVPTKEGIKLELYDKQKALDMLMRYYGKYNDKTEHHIISITPDRARELSSQAHKELQDEGYD